MDGERYDLYFGALRVGTVTQTDSDFPSLWGKISYEPWVSGPRSPDEERLARFVVLTKESMRLVDMEHEVDTSREQAPLNAELEANFMDYVETEQWRLIDRRGHELPILCPILRENSEVVWRWGNPGRK